MTDCSAFTLTCEIISGDFSLRTTYTVFGVCARLFFRLVISMVYYGLALNAGSLAGDIFLNNAMNAMVEIIGHFFVQFTLER